MASIFAHLLDTYPFQVALKAASRDSGQSESTIPAETLWSFLQLLDKSGDFSPEIPGVPSDDDDYTVRRLWNWTQKGSAPHTVSEVNARVRENSYKRQTVARTIEWGHYDGGFIPQEIRVETEDADLRLPLDSAHLHSRWFIPGGWVGESESAMFPLETYLDYSVAMAFAYELVDGGVVPYAPPDDDACEAALEEYQGGGASGSDWLARAKSGSFMAGDSDGSAAGVGESQDGAASAHRIVVVLYLCVTRERCDFEPGGIVGMARLLPQAMVKSSVPVRLMHVTTRVERPATTEELDAGGGGSVCGCTSHPEIGSILVADSNDNPLGPNLAYYPFWSGPFAYYESDLAKQVGPVIHMVRRNKPTTRTLEDCGRRDMVRSPQVLTSVRKLPRQGEFDNLHLAPRLKLDAAHLAVFDGHAAYIHYPIDPNRMRIDPVAMAPYCAHDCLHTHWRWNDHEQSRWVLGWSDTDPYAEVGVPMVQQNHDCDLELLSNHEMLWIERAYPSKNPSEDGSGTIAGYAWQFFFYPGQAYAQGVATYKSGVESWLKRIGGDVSTGLSAAVFSDANKNLLSIGNNTSVFYWNLRFFPRRGSDGQWEAGEWLEISDSDVARARDW